MTVRFTRLGNGLHLSVVPETDADRVALRDFLAGFDAAQPVARLTADPSGGYGFGNCSLASLGPASVSFGPARVSVEHR